MRRESAEAAMAFISARANEKLLGHSPSERAVETESFARPASASTLAPGGRIAVVFASGVVGKHFSAMDMACGEGLSLDSLQDELAEAANDPQVTEIILHLDSPGGSVYGVQQTALLIQRIRAAGTPVYAYTDTMAASAAYWLAAACDRIYVDAHADVGSVGVYSAFYDMSDAVAQQGVAVEVFKNAGADFKAAGLPGTSLTDAQRSEIQSGVDALARDFQTAVQDMRGGVVTDEVWRAGCFRGEAALAAGLADMIVDSLQSVVADIVGAE